MILLLYLKKSLKTLRIRNLLIKNQYNPREKLKPTHGIDLINGPNFEKFFEIFEIESFITIGNASDEFKSWTSENGFEIEYRESIGGYVRK